MTHPLFSYPDLSTIEKNNKRYYVVGDEHLPSVTTILSATKSADSEKALADWRIRVGEEEAAKVLERSLSIGSCIHKNVENYFLDPSTPMTGTLQAKTMTNIMLKKGAVHISDVCGSEVALFYEGLYAGRSDMVGVYKGKLSVIDFKNSVKPKKLSYIDDYMTQISAYRQAHDHMFGTKIEQSVILLVTQDFEFQEFVVDYEEGKKYDDMWLTRLDKFYS